MNGLNVVYLVGRVGARPELRSTASGSSLAYVSVAVSRSRIPF